MGSIEQYIISKLWESLSSGNFKEFAAYIVILILIWFEVRGMKSQLKTLNETVTQSFSEGEKRFDTIEERCQNFEHRITQLEGTSAKANDRIYQVEKQLKGEKPNEITSKH